MSETYENSFKFLSKNQKKIRHCFLLRLEEKKSTQMTELDFQKRITPSEQVYLNESSFLNLRHSSICLEKLETIVSLPYEKWFRHRFNC